MPVPQDWLSNGFDNNAEKQKYSQLREHQQLLISLLSRSLIPRQ